MRIFKKVIVYLAFLFVFSSGHQHVFSQSESTTNAIFGNSASRDKASNAAEIDWPGGSFAAFHERYARKIESFTPIASTGDQAIERKLVGLNKQNIITLSIKSERGSASLHSQESAQQFAPKLQYRDKQTDKMISLNPLIDTSITTASYKSFGDRKAINISRTSTALLHFEFPESTDFEKITDTSLTVYVKKKSSTAVLSLYQITYTPPTLIFEEGLASDYPFDENIESDERVYFADNFNDMSMTGRLAGSSKVLNDKWSSARKISLVSYEGNEHFSSKSGLVANIQFRKSEHDAGNLEYRFMKQHNFEPEEAYFRYYLKIEEGALISGGGKIPGFSGTYNKAGWGGRPNNGVNGWSARGAFQASTPKSNHRWSESMPIGSYFYEAKTGKKYGQVSAWGHEKAAIKIGEWVCIEQYIKLNSVGNRDGKFTGWVNGEKVFSRNNLYFRDTEQLKIEKVWLNFYFGGSWTPKEDFDMYIDNVVIASNYIGLMRLDN